MCRDCVITLVYDIDTAQGFFESDSYVLIYEPAPERSRRFRGSELPEVERIRHINYLRLLSS